MSAYARGAFGPMKTRNPPAAASTKAVAVIFPRYFQVLYTLTLSEQIVQQVTERTECLVDPIAQGTRFANGPRVAVANDTHRVLRLRQQLSRDPWAPQRSRVGVRRGEPGQDRLERRAEEQIVRASPPRVRRRVVCPGSSGVGTFAAIRQTVHGERPGDPPGCQHVACHRVADRLETGVRPFGGRRHAVANRYLAHRDCRSLAFEKRLAEVHDQHQDDEDERQRQHELQHRGPGLVSDPRVSSMAPAQWLFTSETTDDEKLQTQRSKTPNSPDVTVPPAADDGALLNPSNVPSSSRVA